ncbi:hypothetical protein BDB00DRAFT_817702 [Zychaea mexicana]|uniref:uncharacterized protein n=1 Tax=Zychaea mexicana TaxID=64656 RepID=UPI0022FEF654|nr:uncharacterized protein BDB00DRAFT_817702 [Zychaea mexicana]KAI9494654.1 hypothetical protein BDB00DRAFT_817702 [Zychaea mexicana]
MYKFALINILQYFHQLCKIFSITTHLWQYVKQLYKMERTGHLALIVIFVDRLYYKKSLKLN